MTSDARRGQLLELGRSHFLSRSYAEISMDAVAEAAGVSKGLLYHYFPTKRQFYLECLRGAAADLVAAAIPAPDGDVAARLRAGLDGYLEYVETHAEAFAAVLRGSFGVDAEVAAVTDSVRNALYEEVLREVPPASRTRLVELMVRGWIGSVEAVSLEWAADPHPPREVLVELLATQLGVAAGAAGIGL